MKQIICIIGLSILIVTPSVCQTESGIYHGAIEGGYSIHAAGTIEGDWVEINTIHGYQATSNIFVGAGLGFHFMPEFRTGNISGYPLWKRDSQMEVPLFAVLKLIALKKKVSPLIDLRLGHNLANGSGMFGSLGAGFRFSLKNNRSIGLVAAYTIHRLKAQRLDVVSSYLYYKESEENQEAISLRIGYEF